MFVFMYIIITKNKKWGVMEKRHYLFGEYVFSEYGKDKNLKEKLFSMLGNFCFYMIYFFPLAMKHKDEVYKHIIRGGAIFISLLLLLYLFSFSKVLFALHVVSLIVFHIGGAFVNTFNTLFDTNGFEKVWGINNNWKRFFYHAAPITILLLKLLSEIGDFILVLLLFLLIFFEKEN